MRLDKESTDRMIRNALGSQQILEDEKKLKIKANRNLMSSDSDEEDDKRKASKETVKLASSKLAKSKAISKSKISSSKGASGRDMHGATVVPIAAHLKYKKLLEKK